MDIKFPTIDTLPKNVQEKLKTLPNINLYKKMATGYPQGFIQMIDLIAVIYSDQRKISDRLREIGILRIARNTKSEYENYQHYYLSKASGVTDKDIEIIKSSFTVTDLSTEENLICKVADELCSNFDYQTSTEIIVLLAYIFLLHAFISGARVEIEDNSPLKTHSTPI
ncbi:carboxymuconolactone decarboxylase family protein [Francisella philomiragia]|uniref:hypothetical protein n=1 Tax=Francisella philomiragia TaxID=28110 RepID=UPI0019075C8D|nr:hypothetical protein [Francisella philomiragia]MBK2256346.1 hypothetical protein [Francisella philomiragia]MBK2269004.1 hypothetical protein [Francisella philomiragia]MBK2270522.1 hypothetical protein [Francisella philomiragia]MBK2274301.1 hypothetical protein [Francisella philomiragia]MBK2293895.1 hypothetical protein [Francisella philomiragia]